MPANSAMLMGPEIFFADTWPVTMRHSISTVRYDISQVLRTPAPIASSGPARCVSTNPGGHTLEVSRASVIPSRPMARP